MICINARGRYSMILKGCSQKVKKSSDYVAIALDYQKYLSLLNVTTNDVYYVHVQFQYSRVVYRPSFTHILRQFQRKGTMKFYRSYSILLLITWITTQNIYTYFVIQQTVKTKTIPCFALFIMSYTEQNFWSQ